MNFYVVCLSLSSSFLFITNFEGYWDNFFFLPYRICMYVECGFGIYKRLDEV